MIHGTYYEVNCIIIGSTLLFLCYGVQNEYLLATQCPRAQAGLIETVGSAPQFDELAAGWALGVGTTP